MSDFFRFPHTPHLAWLGPGQPRNDKVLDPAEIDQLLSGEVVVEEKIDGANLGISLSQDRQLNAQNRGSYLERPFKGQFSRLDQWLMERYVLFQEHLPTNAILFGEWCAARHSLHYDYLPDWFIVFDVYDRHEGRFWSSDRRDELAKKLVIATAPCIYRGQATLKKLKETVLSEKSKFRTGSLAGSLEGIVIRRESDLWSELRGKLVHPKFTQNIDTHWRSRVMEWNQRQPGSEFLHP